MEEAVKGRTFLVTKITFASLLVSFLRISPGEVEHNEFGILLNINYTNSTYLEVQLKNVSLKHKTC